MTPRDALHHWYHQTILDSWRHRFAFFQRHGLQVVRTTYDSPVPDTRLLQDGRWRQRSQMVGVDVRGDAQLALLRDLSAAWRTLAAAVPSYDRTRDAPGSFWMRRNR